MTANKRWERILMLRGLGYKVSEDAVDAIKAEVDESRSDSAPHDGAGPNSKSRV